MNLQELQNKYEALKETTKALGKEIEALKNKPTSGRWRADETAGYFHVCPAGSVEYSLESGNIFDEFQHAMGNYFKTKEEAEKYKKKLIAEQELKDLAEGWEYRHQEDDYYIAYNTNDRLFRVYSTNFINFVGVYFKSRQEAQNAIDTLGEQKLKLIYGV